MSTKAKIITGYLIIGLLFAIYGANWGDHAYRGIFYNLGIGLVWPVIMFPSLGNLIGGVIMVVVVAVVLLIMK